MGYYKEYLKKKEEESKSTYGGSYYKKWRAENKRAELAENMQSRVGAWMDSHNSFLREYADRFGGRDDYSTTRYVSDAQDWYDRASARGEELRAASEALLADLQKDSYIYGEDYVRSVSGLLTSGRDVYSGIADTAKSDIDFWAQFDPTEQQKTAGYDTAEKVYDAWRQDNKYRTKHTGKTRDEIERAILYAEDETEAEWLRQRATELWTSADEQARLDRAEAERRQLYSEGGADYFSEEELRRMDYLLDTTADASRRVSQLQNQEKYGSIPQNPDFNEKSKPNMDIYTGPDDYVYLYVNSGGPKTLRQKLGFGAPMTDLEYDQMTTDEVSVFNYLYHTEGRESAVAYLETLENTLSARKQGDRKEYWEGVAQEAPILADVASVGGSLAGGIGLIDAIGQRMELDLQGEYYKPINYNSAAMTPSIMSSAIRGERARKWASDSKPVLDFLGIENEAGVIAINAENHPWLAKMFNGRSMGDVYQLGMSMVDSFASSRLAPLIGVDGSSLLLAGNAATQTTLSKAADGATDGQALTMGMLAGAFEFLFEKYEIDQLLGEDTNILRKMGNQAITEGFGEGATSFANAVADVLVMAEQSDISKAAADYQDKHPEWTEEQCLKQALLDTAINIGWDMVGGAVTGSIMGGTESVLQNIVKKIDQGAQVRNNSATRDLYGGSQAELVQEALEIDPDNAYAQKMQALLDKGKNLSGKQLGQLIEQNTGAVRAEYQKTAQARLAELGATGDVTDVARAIAKQTAGEALSAAESQLIETSARARQVAQELGAMAAAEATEASNAETMPEAGMSPGANKRSADLVAQLARETVAAQGADGKSADPVAQLARETVEARYDTENGVGLDGIASTEGKAILDDEAVDVVDIADAGGGKVSLQLRDGRTADTAELSFPDSSEAELWRVIGEYAEDADSARALLKGYQGGNVDAFTYARGIEEAFLYGKVNLSPREMELQGTFVNKLSPTQRNMAYQQGNIAGERKTQRRKEESSKRSTEHSRTGSVNYGYEGQKLDKSKLSKAQRVGVDFAERLARKKGMTFYFFRSYMQNGVRVFKNANGEVVQTAENGWYDPSDGSIHIDLNCGDMGSTVLFTIAHELTHFIQDWSADRYRVLCGIITEGFLERGQSVEKLVKEKMVEYRKRKIELTWEEAYDEVIASSMEGVLSDGRVMDLLDEIETKDLSLWEQIRSFIEDIALLIRDTIQAYRDVMPESPEGRMVLRMKDLHKQLQDVFVAGLHEGGESFRDGGKINTAPEGGVKHSLRIKYANGTEIMEDPSKVTSDKIIGYIKKSRAGLLAEKTYFPVASHTPRIIINTLRRANVDISNKPLAMQARKAKQAQINHDVHTKDGYTIRGHALIAEEVAEAIDKLNTPDAIIQETARKKKVSRDDSTEIVDSPDAFVVFVTLDNGKECVVVIEFDSTIDPDYVERDGKGDDYHTTITVFQPDVARKGVPYDYFEYLASKKTNRVIEITEESSNPETAYGENLTAISEKKLSNDSIRNSAPNVNKNSIRYQKNEAAQEHIAQQNASIAEDMEGLNALVAAQQKQGRAVQIRKSTTDAAAGFLMKTAGAKGEKSQLVDLLSDFYSYVANSSEQTWESIREKAMPVVRWLMKNTVRSKQRSAYAQDILNTLRNSRVSLDETQKGEAAYSYGSFGAYRNSVMGSILLVNDGISLDSQWQEWAGMYPDVFDADMNSADMPAALSDIIRRLRNADTSELEYEYNREFIEHELLSRVYDSYWNASTLFSVAEHYDATIKQLKEKHRKRMREVYARHQAQEATQREAFRKREEAARDHFEERYQRREAEYRESRRQAVERHDKAQVRQRIRKDVQKLDSLLNKGTKEKNVKLELQDFAGAALRTAKGAFLKNYNEYDMIRNGVEGSMTRENRAVFNRAKELLQELDKLWEIQNNEPGPDSLHEKWDPEAALRRDDHVEALKKELAKNMAVLRKAEIFKAENERIEDAVSEELMTELMDAYKALEKSKSAHINKIYNQVLYDQMENVKKFLSGKMIKDMTAIELGELQKMYRMVLHAITTSNDLFAQQRKGDVRKLGEESIEQLRTPGRDMTPAVLEMLARMGWANLKPETALELIGSDTLTGLMQGLYRGEDAYARDIEDARVYAETQRKKYGRDGWEMDKTIPFAGTEITLGQAMSLYAYTRRKQAQGHIEGDGFTHSGNIRLKKSRDKVPVELSYIRNATKTYKVTKDMYSDLEKVLTKAQRDYVVAMTDYLSKVMGAKGNEVSEQLYGIKLFLEKDYFPLKTAGEYHQEALGATTGEVKLKNNGFTIKTVEKASNPVVLDDFESVWAAHVDKMSLYHGFVLPMEDIDRVYNYHHAVEEDVRDAEGEVYTTRLVDTNETVKVAIENKMGKAAVEYIESFMRQLNGGVRGDSLEKIFGGSLVRNFKKTAVLGSLSVGVQQPTAFIRAMAYLDLQDIGDPRSFLGKAGKPEGKILEEMYKYAPVALMKRIGGFDPSLGLTAKGYIFEVNKGLKNKLDHVLGRFPEMMDEWTWSYIWICTKRQIHRKHPELEINSEEFLQKVGERFSTIIRETQVYDSVLTKTEIMRSKNIYLQSATAFMNEPSTGIDMYIRTAIRAKRGKISGKQVARVYAAVVGSQLLTSAVAAFVYALRDDDEDETYWEKYISAAVGKAWENTMPWYSIPFVKDIFSIFDGWSVERSDMSLITDLYQGWNKLKSGNATPWEKVEAFAGSILNCFGIPLKNVSRDVRGIYNTVKTFVTSDLEATGAGLKYAAQEGLKGKEVSKSVQLQNAITEGDVKHLLRVLASYSTETGAFSAFRKAVQAVYLQGDVDKKQAVEYLQVYAGDSPEEAEKKMTQWTAQKETGIAYADIKDSFLSGQISAREAEQMCITYGGYEPEEAQEKITVWSFQGEHPESELTEAKILGFVELAEPAGISLEIYTEYVAATEDLESDRDADGDAITDSKRNKLLAEIHKLPLSRKQKDALYFAAGYSEKRLEETPWH